MPGPDPGEPRVTVVVMTRDRREQLVRTLARLSALPDRPEVIVVDNGSADGTPAAVREMFPRVQVLCLTQNHGAAARTAGLRHASTPYVAFSDDDSWWAPGALRRAADLFERHPRLGLVAARIQVGPERLEDPVRTLMRSSPLPADPGLPGPRVLGFVACGSVVRRSAYLATGGFSPLIFFLGEESVLAQDMTAAGWVLCYVEDVVAHHHPAAGVGRAGRRRLQARNWLLSSWLRRPARSALRDTAHLLRRAGDPELRGALVDAAVRLPAVRADRRRLPAHVENDLRLLEAAGLWLRPG